MPSSSTQEAEAGLVYRERERVLEQKRQLSEQYNKTFQEGEPIYLYFSRRQLQLFCYY